jgi:protein-disulfide isomerase
MAYRLLPLLGTVGLATACAGPASPGRQTVEVRLPASGPWIGREDAELALVEFGSHGCAGCWRFTFEGLPRLMREFVEPGTLRYRYIDVNASPAAALVECRASEAGFSAARATLYGYLVDSAEAGRPIAVPPECLADSAAAARRALEAELARRLKVPGTPTFLIGRNHPGGRVVGWVELGFTGADSLISIVRTVHGLLERQ